MPGSFRFLDDIALADMAFDAEGESLPALFEAATQALIESLADPVTIAETWRHSVDMEEADIETLLFEWLGRLVYLKDAQGVVFHAELTGAPVDPATQDLRSDVKGVTKHLYAVTLEGISWKARVVLDV